MLEWAAIFSSKDLTGGTEPMSPALAGGFFTTESQRDPRATITKT